VLVDPSVPAPSIHAAGENFIILKINALFLVAAYFSPALSTDRFIEDLSDIFALLPPRQHVLLAGDFNCRIDQLTPSDRTLCFLDFLNSAGLRLCSRPTPLTFMARQGSSTIDLFATTLPAEDCSVPRALVGRSIQLLKSHVPVGLDLKCPRNEPLPRMPQRLSRHVRLDLLRYALDDLRTIMMWNLGGIDRSAQLLCDAIRSAIPPMRSKSRSSQPWFNARCFEARAVVVQARLLMGIHPCMRPLFVQLRRGYKKCLKEQRSVWQAAYEERLLAEAEEAPYKFGRTSGSAVICPIQPDVMRAHFRDIAGGVSTAPLGILPVFHLALSKDQTYWNERLSDLFTYEEVQEAIDVLPRGKAGGMDGLTYEHLKNAPELTVMLTGLFNRCLVEASFPSDWTECLMVLIPKGKGDLGSPDAWRGISKKSVLGKLMASLLARRLLRFLTYCDLLPPQQHGFLPGHSTSTAIEDLMSYLKRNLRDNGTPVYAMFIDFRAAFNTASRVAIVNTLAECGVSGLFLQLINVMLAPNLIRLFDGIRILPEFVQDTGLPQGDTIASLLFVVLLLHLPAEIKNAVPAAVPDLYADDVLILALMLGSLREAAIVAMKHAAERGLEINWEKTKILKFRGGGRRSAADVCIIEGKEIPFVSSFVYLGVTFTVTAATFTRHVRDRTAKAIAAIRTLPSPLSLSLKTALDMFRCKIAPMVTYGLHLCWPYLKVSDLKAVDGVLMCYLRRVLGVSKYARSRLVFLLTGARLITTSLRASFQLPAHENYLTYMDQWEAKLAEVDAAFWFAPAMLDKGWSTPLSPMRSALCRHAVHGFHHLFCMQVAFHEPADHCLCRHCGRLCQRYHHDDCTHSPYSSIRQMAMA
jgi:hypothetical protein